MELILSQGDKELKKKRKKNPGAIQVFTFVKKFYMNYFYILTSHTTINYSPQSTIFMKSSSQTTVCGHLMVHGGIQVFFLSRVGKIW